ncbi:MAG: cysteine--tRNA ligase [Candidatus Njordarchaeales archaeon]
MFKIRLYNTLTKRVEEFKPLDDKVVKAYFCGPTVQDSPHIGHARAYISFDIFVRFLRYLSYKVMYIRNITDIDDKIINKARELGLTPFEVAEKYAREFYEAAKELNLIPPNIEPRATGHIPEIIELVQRLIDKNYAYVAENGDVYFDVTKFKDYGKLSGQKLEELIAGARVEPSPYKKNPLDFALWKAAKPGEPSWPSPWGRGRPGWHIECSAMAMKYLGETIDIHGGGMDLIFPHHENEIAQSEAATGKPFARYWFHVGLVTVRKEKMSKSLGNIVSIWEVLKRFDGETIRYWVAQTHYRKPIEFSWDQLEKAEKALDKLYSIIFRAEEILKKTSDGALGGVSNILKEYKRQFLEALADDLNTPRALAILHEIADDLRKNLKNLNKSQIKAYVSLLRELGGIIGILQQSRDQRIEEKRKRGKDILEFAVVGAGLIREKFTEELLNLIIQVRSELRKRKIFDLADQIRERLREMGIILEDTREGTIWKLVK